MSAAFPMNYIASMSTNQLRSDYLVTDGSGKTKVSNDSTKVINFCELHSILQVETSHPKKRPCLREDDVRNIEVCGDENEIEVVADTTSMP